MSGKWSRWGVPVAAVALIAAVWLSLRSARSADRMRADAAVPAVPEIGELPGFRADAWYLPADELLGFVEIPGGAFVMGSDPARDPLAFDIERWSVDRAQGAVELPTYWIGRYEVTVAQYAAFVRESGHRVVDEGALAAPPDHPVTHVSWTDALAYARWLDGVLRDWPGTPAPLGRALESEARVSLPSEAEWEKAARGTDGRLWPWGDEPVRGQANFDARGTAPVGSFDCGGCPYGLADMAGNVWEWTRSPYQAYPYDPSDLPKDLHAEALWVMRGGSYADGERNVRAAIRGGADPGVRNETIGFRVVISRY